MRRLFLCLLLWGFALGAQAQTMVLVHGFESSGADWRVSGVAAVLMQAGWVDAGDLAPGPNGPVASNPPIAAARRFYTVEFDGEAPLWVQLQQLEPLLALVVRRHPNDSLVLVGHSAGAVLARLYMVRHPDSPVRTLISIAGPNLGSGMAEVGNLMGATPLAAFAPLMGAGDFNRAQQLFAELNREYPGSFLYWLNRQPHPPARYISFIRTEEGPLGDMVVPKWSQNLNNVAALRGGAEVVATPGGHALDAADGLAIVRVLAGARGI